MTMTLKAPQPLPKPDQPWVQDRRGEPTQPFGQYMTQLDELARALADNHVGTLVNAANDAAAAHAGVAVGALYRSGSQLMVRVV